MGKREACESPRLALCPPTFPGLGGVGRLGGLDGKAAVSTSSASTAFLQRAHPSSAPGKRALGDLPEGRAWGRETLGGRVPSGASARVRFETTRAELLRCLGEVSSQPKEETEKGEAESC